MDTITQASLQTLLDGATPPCVSILVPVERGVYDQEQARLDLKNLTGLARTELSVHLRPAQIDALLAPADQLLQSGTHWPDGGGGVGLFLSPETSVQVHLPTTVEPLVMVGERFDVLPVLPVMFPDTVFHVLALSRNSLKLYRGTRHTFAEMHVADLPSSLDDALWYERQDNALVAHGGPRMGGSSQPTSVVHGGQAWQDEKKDQYDRYFHHIDKVLETALHTAGAPLVLAAVERELSGFRAASRHPRICAAAIVGNPDDLTPSVLQQRAWTIVSEHLEHTQRDALLQRFDDLAGTRRRSVDAGEILEAAAVGRVETVLIPESTRNWTHAGPRVAGGVDDFVNRVVIEVMTHGGEVALVPASALPPGSAVAAVFRWK